MLSRCGFDPYILIFQKIKTLYFQKFDKKEPLLTTHKLHFVVG
jgi:hypothetical protein